jgi:hypothetical protein
MESGDDVPTGLELYVNGAKQTKLGSFNISQDTDTNQTILLKSTNPASVLDQKTIEWVENGGKGDSAKDFNITASSYMLSADKDGNIKDDSSIILTAHPINLGDNLDIRWSKDNGAWTTKSSSTYTVNKTGTYSAKVNGTDWLDSVTIGKTLDGATGKNAIAITLSNPTMTFHTETSNEAEECQVIVYEGGTSLVPVEYD